MVDIKKEREPQMHSVERNIPPVEMPTKPEANLEVEGWMEKIEKKFARVPSKTNDVADDTVIVQQQAQPQQPPVTLPITQQQMVAGKKAKTDSALAWLVVWAMRQIKQLTRLGKNVRLQDIPEVK